MRLAFRKLGDRIDAAMTDLRVLVREVMPPPLIERGLSAAALDLIDRIPVPTRLTIGVDDGVLPRIVERTAYYVIAVALASVVKHARATEASVSVRSESRMVVIRVRDDGVGGASASSGVGLRRIADRVDVLGGTFEIDSPPGKGTTLTITLPTAIAEIGDVHREAKSP
jgi:signal transduction histidine kinase